jgi:hypothetical protein
VAYRGRQGLAMRRTSPRRFAPLARLCVATVVSLVLASVPKLGDTRESFDQIVGVGEVPPQRDIGRSVSSCAAVVAGLATTWGRRCLSTPPEPLPFRPSRPSRTTRRIWVLGALLLPSRALTYLRSIGHGGGRATKIACMLSSFTWPVAIA